MGIATAYRHIREAIDLLATLTCRRLLQKLRCSTTRITAIVRAVVAHELAA